MGAELRKHHGIATEPGGQWHSCAVVAQVTGCTVPRAPECAFQHGWVVAQCCKVARLQEGALCPLVAGARRRLRGGCPARCARELFNKRE